MVDLAGDMPGEVPAVAPAKRFEPAELDPGFGWLRSRLFRPGAYRQKSRYRVHAQTGEPFCPLPWPCAGHEMACGRSACPVCSEEPPL